MTRIGKAYGEALYGLAREEQLDGIILEELKLLRAAFSQEPDFIRLLSAPNLSKEKRCAVLDNSFRGKVHTFVLNFLKLLTEKGYARHFGDCCDAYRELYNANHGILTVKAVTAVALTDAQTEKLKTKLASLTGKTIELQDRVDPGCLGGVRLDYDGKRVDGTVARRLDAVRSLLKNTLL